MSKFSLPESSPLLEPKFLFGVATSSFQIEGALDSRDRCIWDTFCEKDGAVIDKSNGSVACEHYERWEEDVELVESMGFKAYRLSISWPRVVKQDGSLNQAGITFYKNLLIKLQKSDIKAFVTLYHWDLPQHLEDKGGWLNRDTAYAFQDYTKAVVKEFQGLVYSYATLNEPFCSSYLGYEIGTHAPGITGRKYGRQAAHHLLLAHGLAMDVLSKHSPNTENGIVLNFTTAYAFSESDELAAERANQYFNHWYAKPLFDATYPEVIDDLDDQDKPIIKEGDFDIIAHPLDFLGVNYYTRTVYKDDNNGWFEEHPISKCERTDIGWEVYPDGLTKILTQLNERYNLPPIYITENGAAIHDNVKDGKVVDPRRIEYYNMHLNAVNVAIEKNVIIKGYFAWSLMDNFEWAEGYTQRFGIVYVDFETQARTIKDSGYAFKQLLKSR